MKKIKFYFQTGMIGIGEPAHLTETTGALHAFNIPLVSVVPPRTSSLLSSTASGNQIRSSYSNMLTTAPDMAGQARVKFLIYKNTLENNLQFFSNNNH